MRLGFVGAGRIGRPMVQRLVAAGHQTRVLARSDTARRTIQDDGAAAVSGLAEVAEAADAVLICVHTDGQVKDVSLDGGLIAAMPAGSVLIVHTTCSPRTIDELAARAGERGILLVDAPISGGPPNVAAGQVTLFAGGSDEAIDRARPALAAYGDPILHVGAAGYGQRVKLVNNALFAANIGLVAQAVDLAAQLGLEEPAVLAALQHGSSASRALSGVAGRGSVAAFAAVVGEFLDKDLAVVRAAARDIGADLGPLDAAHRALAGFLPSRT